MLSRCCNGFAFIGASISILAGSSAVTGADNAVTNTVKAVLSKPQAVEGAKNALSKGILYAVIAILAALALAGIILLASKIFNNGFAWLTGSIGAFVWKFFNKGTGTGIGNESVDDAIATAGYAYDPEQDMFYSVMEPWQKKMGYCWLYDEAAAPMGMIIDCEPVTFEFRGKKWMIEFWKGQYDLCTGAEIGIYEEAVDLSIPGIFDGTFYNCARDMDRMHMSYTLKKKGKELFYRDDTHWWLTGFKLGTFSEPWELTMDVAIDFDDPEMCNAFVEGLLKLGYYREQVKEYKNRVTFRFAKPHSKQPISRTAATDWVIQRKNEYMCNRFQEITKSYTSMTDKLNAIKKIAPGVYGKAVSIGRPPKVYEKFNIIKNYIKVQEPE